MHYILLDALGSYGSRTLGYGSLEASLCRRHIDAKVGHSSQNVFAGDTWKLEQKMQRKKKTFMYSQPTYILTNFHSTRWYARVRI